jgi:hypothetical protein
MRRGQVGRRAMSRSVRPTFIAGAEQVQMGTIAQVADAA